ncbi:hypothetical protein Val02_47870 [Virgisporangium aliadipatigenens]|uniref:DUF2550 family protein n=1 Tax=Virgisporangium aliadipatigenens TaxID=741659 RepID=A0A8J3YQ82_9ACTN|nr:hypothetical protein [Virgisporangium aliadipatigenens]GIJ47901.1 hypothetical protein Val02_47870 [Virgisporangium aliadipatigenens]
MGVLYTIAVLLLVGAAAVDGYRRRRFARAGGTFRCRARAPGGPPAFWPGLRTHWSRRLTARWYDNVLVIRRGPILDRAAVLPVRACVDNRRAVDREKPRLCGKQPLVLELTLADGRRVLVAAAEQARQELVGPYLSAALRGLPDGPAPERRIRRAGGGDPDGGERWDERNRQR